MTATPSPHVFLCNGAAADGAVPGDAVVTSLDYLSNEPSRRVNLKLPKFVDQVDHLPARVLDLLEIAAHVFAGDRASYRGGKDSVEYQSWARDMRFVIKVRDVAFWNQERVRSRLREALLFMTGDLAYSFDFVGGHSTAPVSLFDKEDCITVPRGNPAVMLFSGGLDSLSGALDRLQATDDELCLVSHCSGLPSTKKTQRALVNALRRDFEGRIHPYSFECGLANGRGLEETQRTRAFVFGCIAFAVAQRLGRDSFFAYENGVTSINSRISPPHFARYSGEL